MKLIRYYNIMKSDDDKDNTKTETPVIAPKKKTKRCYTCRKRLPLISFTCDCNHIFCISHKAPHSHDCPHNKKDIVKQNIHKNNPKVIQTTLPVRV